MRKATYDKSICHHYYQQQQQAPEASSYFFPTVRRSVAIAQQYVLYVGLRNDQNHFINSFIKYGIHLLKRAFYWSQ